VPADFDALWRLDQECFTAEIAYRREELQSFLDRPGTFTLVAEDGGKLAGFILTHVHKKHGHIITIDVGETDRRSGLGSQLLIAAEARLRALGKEGVALEVAVDNLPALSFYKRHGYAIIKTIPHYYANGVDALYMTKVLGAG
jgi:[ribosomal protein S18]-alanine N-acetyltransferase